MAKTASTRRRPPPRKPASSGRRPAPPPARSFPIWPIVVGLVVLIGVVVIIVAAVSGGGDDTADTGGGDGSAGPVEESAPAVAVTGEALPRFASPDGDPAIGMAFPSLSGIGLDGEPMTIPAGDGPTLVMFVAHWCPHCQREVPLVQEWVDAGNLPDGVNLVAVSTSIDPTRPNYPPSAWLAEEGWTAPTLVDPDNSAALAAGLSGYPFFVALDADGTVVARNTGELTVDQLDAIVDLLQSPA
jgi:thiol-disulfide isomerase/thioredoxin